MMEGEKGQQQIFCSQTKPGEPEDLPIIGSEGGSSSKGKDKKDGKQAKPAEKPKPRPKPQAPPPPQDKQRESHEDDAPVMGARGKHNGIYEDLGAGNNLIHGGSLGSNEGSAKEMAGGNGLVMGGVDSGAAASATLCAGSFVVLAAIFGTLV
ncbi:hypothetical protein FBU59_004176 [Linderina macrospora]|uniref:Uncharacterized protein n=1 Tax=Linderina macrospora TaxID=4868 RepID=A0ACC1J658_9FUNG|nr:hypothetical protein FBU59_004176 [Linderina macrospora]